MIKFIQLALVCCFMYATNYAQIAVPPTQIVSVLVNQNCTFTSVHFNDNQELINIGFVAISPKINLVVGTNDPNVTISNVLLFKQLPASNELLSIHVENNVYDTLLLDSLTIGQHYMFQVVRLNKTNAGDFDVCLSVEKSVYGGTITFRDDITGNTLGSCEYYGTSIE
jgi:hypothetical protein